MAARLQAAARPPRREPERARGSEIFYVILALALLVCTAVVTKSLARVESAGRRGG
jgi:hypothetical protein